MPEKPASGGSVETKPLRPVADALMNDIVKSRPFERSRQLCDLLRYLIEQRFTKNPIALKEYSIALHVFGRNETFDPATDNIVRQEMRRLRTKLSAYYTGEGANAAWIIEVPKGSYAIRFHRRTERLFAVGVTVSHYLIESVVSVNPACVVYRATDQSLGRPAVLTQVHGEDHDEAPQLLAETRLAARIFNDRLLLPYAIERHPSGDTLVAWMHLPHTLDDQFAAGPLTATGIRQIARDAAHALAAGHDDGLVHASLSPGYIHLSSLASRNGPQTPGPAMLAPFGLARLQSLYDDQADPFRAPEVIAGEQATVASDLWSYGALLCALNGIAPPYSPGAAESIPDRQMREIAARCLQNEPDTRHTSAASIRDALQPEFERDDVMSQKRSWIGWLRDRWLTALVLVALLAIAGFTLVRGWNAVHRSKPVTPRVAVLRFENLNPDDAAPCWRICPSPESASWTER